MENIVDIHWKCETDVVVVAPIGGVGHHGAYRRATVQGALVDGTE